MAIAVSLTLVSVVLFLGFTWFRRHAQSSEEKILIQRENRRTNPFHPNDRNIGMLRPSGLPLPFRSFWNRESVTTVRTTIDLEDILLPSKENLKPRTKKVGWVHHRPISETTENLSSGYL